MRKILLAAAGVVALAGAAGLAVAQDGAPERSSHGVFALDANSDGALTRQEFDTGRSAEFTRLDADRNGQLSREEMRAGREHRGGRRHGGGHGGAHMLERADANSDGSITRDEFLARPLEHFQRLDANSDGVISATERPQRGERDERQDRPNREANGDGQVSQAEFAAMGASMFERLDADSDGSVTQAEAQTARPHHRD